MKFEPSPIDFIILGLPRSGTTWLANALTRDGVLCMHDPLYHYHYEELEGVAQHWKDFGFRRVGFSCTGLWNFPNFINSLPREVKIVKLRHDIDKINENLHSLGMPSVQSKEILKFEQITGFNFPTKDLFEYKYFQDLMWYLEIPMSQMLHQMLKEMNVQPQFEVITDSFNRRAVGKLLREMRWAQNRPSHDEY